MTKLDFSGADVHSGPAFRGLELRPMSAQHPSSEARLATIRTATLEDLPEIVALGRRFHAYSPWRDIPFSAEAVEAFAANAVRNGVIFLSEDGMLGGVLSPLYFNPDVVVAAEMVWFAPKGGQALRAAFEAWARAAGAAGVQFSSLADEHAPAVARLFRRAGFVPVETGFFKRFAA